MSELPTLAESNWEKLTFSAKETVYKCYHPLVGEFLNFHDVALRFTLESASTSAGTFIAEPFHADKPWPFEDSLTGRWLIEDGIVLTGATS